MANELLKSCKKYIVERVITPSVYCVSEYERGECYKKEVERFERLVAKDVERFLDPRKIVTGQTVAVKDEQGFHRGLVTDIFNRRSRATYWILLLDYGNIIETDQKNIYFIKNKDLRKKKLGAFEVSIHGIQPAVLKLEGDNNFLGGIIQKRVSGRWSPKAFQFVRDIINKNPCVFVKTISNNKTKRTISGEIYFMEESDMPISLGEKLCAKGFAASCDASSKSLSHDSLQGDSDTGIEEKIPDRALVRETQNSDLLKVLKSPRKERSKISSLCGSSDGSIFALQRKLESKCAPSLVSSASQNQSVDTCLSGSLSSSSVNYSSSWILKKCQSRIAPPIGINKSKGDTYESEQGKSGGPGGFNESIFKVVLRSMELFNKKKQIERFCCK